MERWVLLRKGADFKRISEKFHISPRLAALIRNRDIIGEKEIESYLCGTVLELYDGALMKDMEKAVSILWRKIGEKKKLRVIGDYDIDGVNASYILLESLLGLGADADTDIPDRITDGYGLNKNLIDRAFSDGIDTVITCDNGIAAAQEIAYAKSLQMTVIVTDHHEVPFTEEEGEKRYMLPPADAVVNPKQEGCPYPFKKLCGAAVAYKLAQVLYRRVKREEELAPLLEEVAIATVGDIMDLTGENRILVKEGLARLKRTSNKGLRALMERTGIEPEAINSYHLGFVLGPCINAGGRLDTAKRSLKLLRASTKKEADILAGDLKALNDSRKAMTEEAVEQAKTQAEEALRKGERVLVLYLPSCHESLAGIVAGRIREKYYRPVFVLTDTREGAKGSGRSIESYHMYEELNKCSRLLTKFGGHKLAAGMSLKRENVERLREALNAFCTLSEEDLQEKVVIDMELPFSGVTRQTTEELKLLEPFGKGNEKPVFAQKDAEILSIRIIGKNRNMLKMRVRDLQGVSIDALYFGDGRGFLAYLEEKYGSRCVERLLKGQPSQAHVSLTYYPAVNEYRGEITMQIIISHYK